MSLSVDFRGLVSCSFGDGTSVSFWEDIWDMGLLKLEFPQLFSFAKDTKNSVATFLSRDIENNFLLPLSTEASMQLTELAGRILNIHGISHGTDGWTYQWGSTFSCKQAYSAIQGIMTKQVQFTWLWKNSCRGKHKFFFFFWLLLERLNTRNLLKRKHFTLPSYNCVVCQGNVEETVEHLFFGCPYRSAVGL
jgi:hypothetical protein